MVISPRRVKLKVECPLILGHEERSRYRTHSEIGPTLEYDYGALVTC